MTWIKGVSKFRIKEINPRVFRENFQMNEINTNVEILHSIEEENDSKSISSELHWIINWGKPQWGGGGEVLNKVLYGKTLPRGPTPYPFIDHFWLKTYPFHIPSIEKWYPFHIPTY